MASVGVRSSEAGAERASSNDVKPGAPPTARRTASEPGSFTFAAPSRSVTRWRTPPRAMRSATSAGVSCAVAGMTTTPSRIAASIVSQRGHDIGEHEEETVPLLNACVAKVTGDTTRAVGELREGDGLDRSVGVGHQLERMTRLAAGHDVEPIPGPIEGRELGPAELQGSLFRLASSIEEHLTRSLKSLGRSHAGEDPPRRRACRAPTSSPSPTLTHAPRARAGTQIALSLRMRVEPWRGCPK